MPPFTRHFTCKARQSTCKVRQAARSRPHAAADARGGYRTGWPAVIDASPRARLRSFAIVFRGTAMNDDATERVIELARHVIGYMQTAFPGWQEVYVCFNAPGDAQYGVRASYATASGVELISTMAHRELVGGIMRIGPPLRDALAHDGKRFRAALFRANARFSYRMDYDWDDAARWNITKLRGASGRPDGLEALEPLD
ncbi:hypothetical protein [Burkholderia seminalis]|uniref:hypothetical protein n=1 Tax=Burkholderia seminalis TaxID=488731 RepID=UPI001ABB309F|nr:hypothetical protein [Burkholderia seminalis]